MPTTRARTSSIVPSLVLISACATSNTLQGKVTSMPGSASDGSYVPERALAGARVAVECDNSPAKPLTLTTDSNGKVFGAFEHPIPGACKIRVTLLGFRERVFRVSDVCALDNGDDCLDVSLSARLLPAEVR